MNKKIEIFSTPTCHFCNLAKEWLKGKGFDYTEYNVAVDINRRKELVEISGQMGVPVIRIGEDILVGFNPQKMSQILSQ